MPVSLNYRLWQPRFPSPVLVFVINLGLARKFSHVLLHNFVAGQRGSIGRDTHLLNSNYGTPGSLRLSPSLPTPYEHGECPLWHLPHRCPRGILVLRVPFPWATRAHYTNSVTWTHGLLLRFPGCPLLSTHISSAMLPAGQ